MYLHSGSKKEFRGIGVMSGTSLDGLDVAACIFIREKESWKFTVEHAVTIPYSPGWEFQLSNGHQLNGEELMVLHSEFGNYIGSAVHDFIKKTSFYPDLIASHGHTIFHQPERGITFQAGCGAMIAARTGIMTVADFRITDVALGGQGAPLVPAGDRLLFPDYRYCLNLGGFGNLSTVINQQLLAYDICPVNFVLNHLARKTGNPFDMNGEIGRTGKLSVHLLDELNHLDFYQASPPKSLGREWVEKYFFPCIDQSKESLTDIMHTVYEHIATQIGKNFSVNSHVLVTGGGAFNKYLIERIRDNTSANIILPGDLIINYKEAMIFAFLGVLRILGQINCFSSVTGAKKDSSCGLIFDP